MTRNVGTNPHLIHALNPEHKTFGAKRPVTTDLDQATADHVGTLIARMQCTRAEFIRALVHAYLQEQEQG